MFILIIILCCVMSFCLGILTDRHLKRLRTKRFTDTITITIHDDTNDSLDEYLPTDSHTKLDVPLFPDKEKV